MRPTPSRNFLRKFHTNIFRLLISGIFILGPGNLSAFAQTNPSTGQNSKKRPYVSGKIIVRFKTDGTQAISACPHCLQLKGQRLASATLDGSDSLDTLFQKSKVRKVARVFKQWEASTPALSRTKFHQDVERARRHADRGRVPRVRDDLPDLTEYFVVEVPDDADIETICALYEQDPHVASARPNYVYQTNFLPNDPRYGELWGLKKIQTEPVWDLNQGRDVVVAVIDSGVDYLHPDMAANIWRNPGEIPGNGIDDDGNGYIDDDKGFDFVNGSFDPLTWTWVNDTDGPLDDHGHGSHVAGIISAVGNNGLGVIGVAPQARIMAVKGLGSQGEGDVLGLASGILYAALNGARVINNSWGSSERTCLDPNDPATCHDPFFENILSVAHELGAVVVFAAGNGRDTNGDGRTDTPDDVQFYSPTNMTSPKPVVVAATDPTDRAAWSSNFGELLDVGAPGVSILSLGAGSGDYVIYSGTSMAAPHVSGLAALILSAHPELTPDEVREAIRNGSDDVGAAGFDVVFGAGRVNAFKSLAGPVPNRPPDAPVLRYSGR